MQVYLKELHLENFQAHSNLKLNFEPGVNTICGETNKGKSSIRRAIDWLFFNQKIDGVRKHGSKKTSVTATLSNGNIISKVKSASINAYILIKDGQEYKFDAVGKTIPQEILDATTILPLTIDEKEINVNIASSYSTTFLFDPEYKASFRMKLFNLLTGNDILDKLFTQFNKDILHFNKENKREKETFENRIKLIEEKEEEKEQLEAKYSKLQNLLKSIKEKQEKLCKLLELTDLHNKAFENLNLIQTQLHNLIIPEHIELQGLIEKNERFSRLKLLQDDQEALNSTYSHVRVQLKNLVNPDVNMLDLGSKIERFQELQNKSIEVGLARQQLDKEQNKWYTIKEELKKTSADLCEFSRQFVNLLKEAKVCPLCNSEMSHKHIEGIKI